jgi:excisionase family DNA binding protein
MQMLTTTQVAAALDVSPDTVLRLIKLGELRSEQLLGRSPHRIPKADLLAFAERKRLTLQWDKLDGDQ